MDGFINRIMPECFVSRVIMRFEKKGNRLVDDEVVVFTEKGTPRPVQLKVEGDISSIYQMPGINPDLRHSALFLMSKAACR